jgi:hypothetical protein
MATAENPESRNGDKPERTVRQAGGPRERGGWLAGIAPGPRVIEQTIRETLPPGFQRSEYLVEKGMVDRVVPRKELPAVLGSILQTLMMGCARAA